MSKPQISLFNYTAGNNADLISELRKSGEKNDDEEFVDDTKTPDEWSNNLILSSLCNKIQNEYNSLFIDNEIEFKYVCFNSTHDKNQFIDKTKKLIDLVYQLNNKKYVIKNDIDNNFYSTL